MTAKETIQQGKAILGIEFGSTRIKAVLVDQENNPIAQGSHEWENQLVNNLWTYSIDAIWSGLQDCYADLRKDVKAKYDSEIEKLAAIGISAMMHGYMAFICSGPDLRGNAVVTHGGELLHQFIYRTGLVEGRVIPAAEHLYESPLRPLVIIRVTGPYLTVPVIGETYAVQLGTVAADVLYGGTSEMLPYL